MRPNVALTVASVLVALVALVVGASGCAKKESPEAQIRKVIDAGAAALENRDASAAADTLSDDYADSGHRDKKKLKTIAFFALQQGPVIVSVQNVDIQVDGASATAHMNVLAVQGNAEIKTASDLLPTNAHAFDLTLRFKREGKDWKITAIDGLHLGGLD